MVRVVRQQKRLSREVAQSPLLEIFETQMATSLGNLLQPAVWD